MELKPRLLTMNPLFFSVLIVPFMELKPKRRSKNCRTRIVLIVPFMELKLLICICLCVKLSRLNRTFYGIESSLVTQLF